MKIDTSNIVSDLISAGIFQVVVFLIVTWLKKRKNKKKDSNMNMPGGCDITRGRIRR